MASKRKSQNATSARWKSEVPITGQKVIPANPRVVDSLRNIGYSIEAAVADLIDNSIDAKARNVLVRFIRTDDEILRLEIVDDGEGMTREQIDNAMQFGGQRNYLESDLGMYGMGLKSASLSQADSVTVLSKAAGKRPVGRRWRASEAKAGWKCDVVSPEFAHNELDRTKSPHLSLKSHGTIVRWDDVRDFQKASGKVDSYLRRVRIAITNHVGLQLHRHLGSGSLVVAIDTENVQSGEIGIQTEVKPLDPFSYDRTGARGYPKVFRITIPELGELLATAHIWPARSRLEGYRLGGGAVAQRQGFYFFRHDRLIQAGGWNFLRDDAEPHLSLARVEVDLPAEFTDFFSVRFSKSAIDAPRSFVDAVGNATAADGTTFKTYIEKAVSVYRTRSEARIRPVVPLGRGVRSEVRRAVRANLPSIPKDDPIDIAWKRLPADQFFQIDRNDRRLILNSRFRKAVLGGKRASSADAPLVKTLLFLLVNNTFATQRESAVERARLDAYQAVFVEAARFEIG